MGNWKIENSREEEEWAQRSLRDNEAVENWDFRICSPLHASFCCEIVKGFV